MDLCFRIGAVKSAKVLEHCQLNEIDVICNFGADLVKL